MTPEQLRLLREHQIVILPLNITHEVYEMMVETTLVMRGQPFSLYCAGDGGNSRAALAIVDLLRGHGNVDGMLYSEANSSHATIYAGCARRWVSQHGQLGIHMVSWDGFGTRVDAITARQIADEYEAVDFNVARVLASASLKNVQFWLDRLRKSSGAIHQLDASTLISIGMARPISEYKPAKVESVRTA